MKERAMTCIICPRGCRLSVRYDNHEFISCTGNTCLRGEKYAADEIHSPVRTLTTTVRTNSASVPMLPVKTSVPIHKDKLFDAMIAAAQIEVSIPVKAGDPVCRGFVEPGVDLIAGRDILH
ncbi:MAG TPA: DUF1667 domain-containing protein [Bacillota bacterium]|nr:DUF1667 domain-containing protein [Bacillota bacterium]